MSGKSPRRNYRGHTSLISPPSDVDKSSQEHSSQDINKPSDGQTGMSQDFEEMYTVTSPRSARSTGSARSTRSARPNQVIPGPAPTLMPPPARRFLRARRTDDAAAASSTSSTSPTTSQSISLPSIKSFGTIAVVKRPSSIKKDNIEPYALQNTFYAYPLNAPPEVKSTIETKNKAIIDNFKFQKYEVEVFEFGLPFEVSKICRIDTRCGMTPKRHKISTAGSKRKKDEASSSSESDIEDADEQEDTPVKKRR